MKWQLRDVKVIRRAEIGSAHYLLLMIIMLKLKREKPRESRTGSGSIRVKKLRNKDVRWKFEARLRSRYRVDRQIGDQDIEAAWAELKEGNLRSAMEVCGRARTRSERCRSAWSNKEILYKMKSGRRK